MSIEATIQLAADGDQSAWETIVRTYWRKVFNVAYRFVGTYDEAALCRILLEISLLDSAYMRSGASDDLLTHAAKRYRVDVEKLEKAVVAELAAKRSKEAKPKTTPKTKSVT